MYSKDLLSPYTNKFKAINQQMSYSRLDLCSKDQKVIVNFKHDLWEFLDKTVDSDVLKKNINVPQFARLERRAETRAEEARVETKKQQNIAEIANMEAEKTPTDTKNAKLDTKEAKHDAEEA